MKMKRHDVGNIGGRQFPKERYDTRSRDPPGFFLVPFLLLSFLEKQLFDKILIE